MSCCFGANVGSLALHQVQERSGDHGWTAFTTRNDKFNPNVIRRNTSEGNAIGAQIGHARWDDRCARLRGHERQHCLHEVRFVLHAWNEPGFTTYTGDAVEESRSAAPMKQHQRRLFQLS